MDNRYLTLQENASGFIGFPAEIWSLIMNNLSYRSVRFDSVSKLFSQIVYQSITSLSSFYDEKLLRNIDDDFIGRFPNLKEFDLEKHFPSPGFTDNGLKSLKM